MDQLNSNQNDMSDWDRYLASVSPAAAPATSPEANQAAALPDGPVNLNTMQPGSPQAVPPKARPTPHANSMDPRKISDLLASVQSGTMPPPDSPANDYLQQFKDASAQRTQDANDYAQKRMWAALADKISGTQTGIQAYAHYQPKASDLTGAVDADWKSKVNPVDALNQTYKGANDAQTAAQNLQIAQEAADPSSEYSATKRQFAKMELQNVMSSGAMKDPSALKQLSDSLDGKSGAEIEKIMETPAIKAMAESARTSMALELADRRAQLMQDRFHYKENQDANTAVEHNKDIQSAKARLDGVSRINGLLNSGRIVTNGEVKGLIEGEIARLEQGSQTAGLGATERASTHSAQEAYARLKEFYSGSPQNAVPPAQLAQLRNMLNTMGESYVQQYNNQLDVVKQGRSPEQQAVIESKRGALNNLYNRDSVSSSASAPGAVPSGPPPNLSKADFIKWRRANGQ